MAEHGRFSLYARMHARAATRLRIKLFGISETGLDVIPVVSSKYLSAEGSDWTSQYDFIIRKEFNFVVCSFVLTD